MLSSVAAILFLHGSRHTSHITMGYIIERVLNVSKILLSCL